MLRYMYMHCTLCALEVEVEDGMIFASFHSCSLFRFGPGRVTRGLESMDRG